MKPLVSLILPLLVFVLLVPAAQATEVFPEPERLTVGSSSIVNNDTEEGVVDEVVEEKEIEESIEEAVELASSTASSDVVNVSSTTLHLDSGLPPHLDLNQNGVLDSEETRNGVFVVQDVALPPGEYSYSWLNILPGVTLTLLTDPELPGDAGRVIFDNAYITIEPGGQLVADTLELRNWSYLEIEQIDALAVDRIVLTGSSGMRLKDGTLAPVAVLSLSDRSSISAPDLTKVLLIVGRLSIDASSFITVDWGGYGPYEGPGSPDATDVMTGASHGGLGWGVNPKPTYGSEQQPTEFGSGGGAREYYRGGGVIKIEASEIYLDGEISARAHYSSSGGSIWIETAVLAGEGGIVARGGSYDAFTLSSGPGAGGRIAIYYDTADEWSGYIVVEGGRAQERDETGEFQRADRGSLVFKEREVLEPPCTENCNSSVLFLPGIQASRLYKTGLLGFEDKLWEPTTNQDVRQLALTESGMSVNDIYTRDVVDEVVIPVLGANIYKGFIGMMNGMVSDGLISEWQPFAYDWRFAVNDIVVSGTRYENEVRSLIDAVENLAESSNTGEVTIIAHSNGGLLAKSLLIELERIGRADLIDSIVFIGTPHLGTPKAIGTVLHGYDQQKLGGLLIDDKDAREVINNMPGAYALLPSEAYLNKASEPVISIEDSTATADMYARYGGSVDSAAEYVDFLNGAEGRTNIYDNISIPYTTNPEMLENALASHRNPLDNWQPPPNVSVYNIVGVGLKTISAVHYREVKERFNCSLILLIITCDEPEKFIRPYAHFTSYGDETVTSISAESAPGETYYFDFEEYDNNTDFTLNLETHADFTEIKEIQQFINTILLGEVGEVAYLSSTKPTYSQEYSVITIDSPVQIFAKDESGRTTGVVTSLDGKQIVQEIPQSQYFEFGGTKYLLIPKDITAELTLKGEAYGSYTLTTATIGADDIQRIDTILSDATTTPQLVAHLTILNGEFSKVLTDIDGDGEAEYEQSLTGELIVFEEVSFARLRSQILTLNLKSPRQKTLLSLVDVAERFSDKQQHPKLYRMLAFKGLDLLSQMLKLYQRHGLLTVEEVQSMQQMIIELRANI